jgi:peptidoglycan-associated lipoprotein
MWVTASVKFAATVRPAAIAACLLFAGCAENKLPGPEAQATGGVEVGTPQDFLLNVGDRVFFTENSTDLSQTATASLDKQSAWLAKYPSYRVTVEGHSDEKGNAKKNKNLSEKRALAVQNYLASRGVNKSRIHTVSFGREKRVATCNDISCWSQNRRAVTILQTSADTSPRGRPHAQPKQGPQARQNPPAQQMPVYADPPQTALVRNESVDMSSNSND